MKKKLGQFKRRVLFHGWQGRDAASAICSRGGSKTSMYALSTKAAFISLQLILSIGNPHVDLAGHFADNSGGKSDKDRIGDMDSRPRGRSGYS